MPRFDGTGPQGQGPMTGRGEGDCVGGPGVLSARAGRLGRWPRPVMRLGRAFGRGRGRGMLGRRRRRFIWW